MHVLIQEQILSKAKFMWIVVASLSVAKLALFSGFSLGGHVKWPKSATLNRLISVRDNSYPKQ